MFDSNSSRHRCRNARCKVQLKEPVANPRDAFCCTSCEAGFYRTHCRVCEKELGDAKRNSRRELCGKRKCTNEFRSDRKRAQLVSRYYPLATTSKPEKSSTKSTLKTGIKSDRVWRKVAGPDVPEINYRIPLRSRARSRTEPAAPPILDRGANLIGPTDWPVNILGGDRSVAIDRETLAEIIATEIDGFESGETDIPVVASDWKPCVPSSPITDDLSIPAFVRRRSS